MIRWIVIALFLSGCASLQDIGNILTGKSVQKITRTPIWTYKSDIKMTIAGHAFYGMGVTTMGKENMVMVQSEVNVDRVEISTCSRLDVCQVKGGALACDTSRFTVDSGWFGGTSKFMGYTFVPDLKEMDDSCANMTISIYDKNALAAWGFLIFRTHPENQFPAVMTCNASDLTFAGVSVCSAKAGTIQMITFDTPIEKFRADGTCNLKQISDTKFEFQPVVGWCRATFAQNKKFHDVVLNGFDEILIRDGG